MRRVAIMLVTVGVSTALACNFFIDNVFKDYTFADAGANKDGGACDQPYLSALSTCGSCATTNCGTEITNACGFQSDYNVKDTLSDLKSCALDPKSTNYDCEKFTNYPDGSPATNTSIPENCDHNLKLCVSKSCHVECKLCDLNYTGCSSSKPLIGAGTCSDCMYASCTTELAMACNYNLDKAALATCVMPPGNCTTPDCTEIFTYDGGGANGTLYNCIKTQCPSCPEN